MSKKVLIIINNFGVGGAERLTVDEANEMLRLGIDVRIVTLKSEPKNSLTHDLRLRPYNISFNNISDIAAWFKLARFIREWGPDLVITQLWFANTIGRVAALMAGTKRVISFEQNVYDTIKTRKMFFADWLLQPLSIKIIAVSEAVKRSLIRHHIRASKIDVLHNGLDITKYILTGHADNVRKEYDIPSDKFLYVFVGRLIHQKAVDVLINALKEVSGEAYLLIVGQGKDLEQLKQQAQASGQEKRVVFGGVRSDIPQLLATADCFVLPSRYEGLPLVLTEALAAGKPIIVSDFEAAKEVITDGENGLIVPREDSHALANAMSSIKSDKQLRSNLADSAKKSAERFSISHHVEAVLRYIDN